MGAADHDEQRPAAGGGGQHIAEDLRRAAACIGGILICADPVAVACPHPPGQSPRDSADRDVRRRDDLDLHGSITAPTLITFGRHELVTSTRFAEPLTSEIAGSELIVFEDCSHAPIYENVEAFNARTLEFLDRHAEAAAA
jgi:pimeloyl-ACP methyl ester carboxylesterase